MPDFRDDDIHCLKRCLEETGRALDDFEKGDSKPDVPWIGAFQRMLIDLEAGTWYELTEKQRAWVELVFERLFDEDGYPTPTQPINRSSYGRTEIPAVLKVPLPKKPPGRR